MREGGTREGREGANGQGGSSPNADQRRTECKGCVCMRAHNQNRREKKKLPVTRDTSTAPFHHLILQAAPFPLYLSLFRPCPVSSKLLSSARQPSLCLPARPVLASPAFIFHASPYIGLLFSPLITMHACAQDYLHSQAHVHARVHARTHARTNAQKRVVIVHPSAHALTPSSPYPVAGGICDV